MVTPHTTSKGNKVHFLQVLPKHVFTVHKRFGSKSSYIKRKGTELNRHIHKKIADFSDLRSLATYGFRGEALNALCGLSEVEIETKRRSDPVGRKFTFDASGAVKTSAPLAMNPGTTVVAKNMFHNLPVRRNLYKKGNRKKEELKRVEYFCKAYGIVR